MAVGLPEVEDAADVGVADLSRELHLAREAIDPPRLGAVLGAQHLDGDVLAEHAIARLHDDARAAAAEQRA